MMEMVELVEVVEGVEVQEQQGTMENFEDLILTVVPEGETETEVTDSTADTGNEIPQPQPQTILVTEVRHHRDKKDEEIDSLRARVEELEGQVHFLEDELRLIRRKVQGHNINSIATIRRTVLEVLNKQTIKIALEDFDEEVDLPELVTKPKAAPGRSRPTPSPSPKRRKLENGAMSDDEDDDFDSAEDEAVVPVRKRRPAPIIKLPNKGKAGKPKKAQLMVKKARMNRMELTPPPQKSNRPRGTSRRSLEIVASMTPVVKRIEIVKEEPYDEAEEIEKEINSVKFVEEVEDIEESAPITKPPVEVVTPAKPLSKNEIGVKKGKGQAIPAKKESDAPVRTSARMRRTSRKVSD